MKRRIAAWVMLALLLPCAARAEAVMAELRNMRKSAGDRIVAMESVPTPTPMPEATPEPTPTPDVHFDVLASGMKGDEVKELQQRLIDLGFLGGRADGSYGANTAAAVKAFQQSAGLDPTGEADDATQKALYWSEAPVQPNYEKLNYRSIMDDPFIFTGTAVRFTGSVLQVLESDEYADTRGIYTALRVATKGGYDDVVYVAYFRNPSAETVSEGSDVSVFGTINGLYSYTTESGEEITLPRIEADGVE